MVYTQINYGTKIFELEHIPYLIWVYTIINLSVYHNYLWYNAIIPLNELFGTP